MNHSGMDTCPQAHTTLAPRWAPIPGFDAYMVSDDGQVKRVSPNARGRFAGTVMRKGTIGCAER